MRSKLLVPLLALAATAVAAESAESDFTAEHCFQAGDSTALGFALVTQAYEDFLPKTGDQYTWDFSGATTPGPWTTWTKPTVAYRFQAASKSLHASFAASEVNEYSLGTFPRDLFYTYSADKDTLYYDGLYTSSNYLYTPRIPYLAFPLAFNDSGSVHVDQFGNPSQPAVRTGSVTRTWTYDGYGTVKFPYGSAADVFRIRTKQTDSTIIATLALATVYEELIWFRKADGIPVLRLLKNGTATTAYFASAEAGAGISRKTDRPRHRLVVENKGRMATLFTHAPPVRVRIHDHRGRLVYAASGSGDRIHAPSLASGLHYVHLTYGDGSSTREKLLVP